MRHLRNAWPLLLGLVASAMAQEEPSWLHGLGPARRVMGLHVWQWIGSGLLLLFALASGLIAGVVLHIMGRRFRRGASAALTRPRWRAITRSSALLVAAAVAFYNLDSLELKARYEADVAFVLKIAFAIGWAWLLTVLWDAAWDGALSRASERSSKVIVPVFGKLGRFAIGAGVILYVLSSLGFNVAGLAAGLGLGGLVVALAAKDTVENFFGSVTVLVETPFGVGDWVKIDKIEGAVEDITLRSTRIRTLEDSLITLPNSTLIKASVENLGLRRSRRMSDTLSLPGDTSPDKVQALVGSIRRALGSHEKLVADSAIVGVSSLADGVIKLTFSCNLNVLSAAEEVDVKQDVLLQVLRLAKEAGVTPAAPVVPA